MGSFTTAGTSSAASQKSLGRFRSSGGDVRSISASVMRRRRARSARPTVGASGLRVRLVVDLALTACTHSGGDDPTLRRAIWSEAIRIDHRHDDGRHATDGEASHFAIVAPSIEALHRRTGEDRGGEREVETAFREVPGALSRAPGDARWESAGASRRRHSAARFAACSIPSSSRGAGSWSASRGVGSSGMRLRAMRTTGRWHCCLSCAPRPGCCRVASDALRVRASCSVGCCCSRASGAASSAPCDLNAPITTLHARLPRNDCTPRTVSNPCLVDACLWLSAVSRWIGAVRHGRACASLTRAPLESFSPVFARRRPAVCTAGCAIWHSCGARWPPRERLSHQHHAPSPRRPAISRIRDLRCARRHAPRSALHEACDSREAVSPPRSLASTSARATRRPAGTLWRAARGLRRTARPFDARPRWLSTTAPSPRDGARRTRRGAPPPRRPPLAPRQAVGPLRHITGSLVGNHRSPPGTARLARRHVTRLCQPHVSLAAPAQ